MIASPLSAIWATIVTAFGGHLWQSTLFAILAGPLTLILRKNRAETRYGVWLAASIKFLVPFSLLVDLGRRLAWLRGPATANVGLYLTVERVSEPLAQRTMAHSRVLLSTVFPSLIHLLPILLATVWFCGFLGVFVVWFALWRRISAVASKAVPLREGREAEALRRLEHIAGVRKRIELLSSRVSLEPGVLGILRPVLLWPQGISARLDGTHLEAILAHEVWHVRRQDNLTAALHMVVKAIFWFHPLVWWLGARMIEERERACDEGVLELGADPQVYSESILKVCEFCVGSPLACVSGVTGADLKKGFSTS